MAGIKISKKVWESLKPYEQKYIIENAQKHGLQYCKIVLSEIKKQLRNEKIISVHGVGFIICENGKYVFSGQDTRKFTKLK